MSAVQQVWGEQQVITLGVLAPCEKSRCHDRVLVRRARSPANCLFTRSDLRLGRKSGAVFFDGLSPGQRLPRNRASARDICNRACRVLSRDRQVVEYLNDAGFHISDCVDQAVVHAGLRLQDKAASIRMGDFDAEAFCLIKSIRRDAPFALPTALAPREGSRPMRNRTPSAL